MKTSDVFWAAGRVYMGVPARLVTRARAYGRERVPREGGLVIAINHLHWLDVPILGALSPRNLDFVAKAEAINFPGLGKFLRWHGTIGVRRGESDRDAVRQMRAAVRNGRALGLFVEGTRQRSGPPGQGAAGCGDGRHPGGRAGRSGRDLRHAVLEARQLRPCTIAFGEPMRFDGLPKNGRGYKEATAEIEARIHGLFDWLADLHARGRPKGATPP